MDGTLLDTTTPDKSGPGSNGNDQVLPPLKRRDGFMPFPSETTLSRISRHAKHLAM